MSMELSALLGALFAAKFVEATRTPSETTDDRSRPFATYDLHRID
ncbi:MAG: hypothetical protein ACI8QS_000469 [Planctomycetota bacterium]|jgi:hypothetical protein